MNNHREIAAKIVSAVWDHVKNEALETWLDRPKAVAVVQTILATALDSAPGMAALEACEAIRTFRPANGDIVISKSAFEALKTSLRASLPQPVTDEAKCPHCFGERSLGDCQVTQRLHAEALARVSRPQPLTDAEIAEAQRLYEQIPKGNLSWQTGELPIPLLEFTSTILNLWPKLMAALKGNNDDD